jgi:hypothetical protein
VPDEPVALLQELDVPVAALVLPAAYYRLEAALLLAADYPAAAFALLVVRAYRLAQPAYSCQVALARVEPEAVDSNSAAALPQAVSPEALPDAHSNFHRADSHHYQQASLAEPVAMARSAALEPT